MNYKGYGKENRDVIILLHGGGLSCWNYREEAETLQNKFHVIIPILDGHTGSDNGFTTIEDNAKETCGIAKQNMIAFLQANSLYSIKESIETCTAKVKVFVGERENAAMKKSAQIINEKLKNSSLRVMRKMYHGEFSINHANDYVEEILAMVKV